jgi:hypothetical protein
MVPKLVEKFSGCTSTPRVAARDDVNGRFGEWLIGNGGLRRSEKVARTDVFFLKFTSQVALDVEQDQHTIGWDNG